MLNSGVALDLGPHAATKGNGHQLFARIGVTDGTIVECTGNALVGSILANLYCLAKFLVSIAPTIDCHYVNVEEVSQFVVGSAEPA